MCPVCTVTVIAGLGISRILGIDDIITSIWIGGFILSFSFVTFNWLSRRWPKLHTTFYLLLITIAVYLLALMPLYLNRSIGIAGNALWGIDKILLGTFVGSAAFLIGILKDRWIRKVFKKQFFPFQKVAFPVLMLIITSLVFYFLTK